MEELRHNRQIRLEKLDAAERQASAAVREIGSHDAVVSALQQRLRDSQAATRTVEKDHETVRITALCHAPGP